MLKIFYIGGARDKRRFFVAPPTFLVKNKIMKPFDALLDKFGVAFQSFYFGYYEICNEQKIAKNVVSLLNKNDKIVLIGHSLGGYNAAFLAHVLEQNGWRVAVLVTLDGVGRGFFVRRFCETCALGFERLNRLWHTKARQNSEPFWIDITSTSVRTRPDFVALLGGRVAFKKADVSVKTRLSHTQIYDMFFVEKLFSGELPAQAVLKRLL